MSHNRLGLLRGQRQAVTQTDQHVGDLPPGEGAVLPEVSIAAEHPAHAKPTRSGVRGGHVLAAFTKASEGRWQEHVQTR